MTTNELVAAAKIELTAARTRLDAISELICVMREQKHLPGFDAVEFDRLLASYSHASTTIRGLRETIANPDPQEP